ncbi:MAG: hypothetical protein IJS46_04770 [Kiritimatiellae bacterium]|nr:hypothetical protein [Kiritimatiellia bacterium]
MKFGVATAVKDGRSLFGACAASVAASAEAARLAPHGVRHFVQESSLSRDTVLDIADGFGCDFSRERDDGIYDGIGKALDRAAASGADVLSWLNADEQYLPAAFGAAQRIFESNRRISIVFGDYLMLDGGCTPRAARREIPVNMFLLRSGVNYLMSCTVFFRREVWEALRPFSRDYRLLADKEFYMRALGRGFKAALATEYIGAFAATGRNASLDFAAAASESERLRRAIGGLDAPLARLAARAGRVAQKALHGCYFPERVETTVFRPDGSPASFSGRLSPFWKWSAT